MNHNVRRFSNSSGNLCYKSSKEDIAAGRNIYKHAFRAGPLKCSIVFREGNTLEESQLCNGDIMVYSEVIEAVKSDGSFAYSLRIDKVYAANKGRPNPNIKAIVCDSAKSAVEDGYTLINFAGWNEIPTQKQLNVAIAGH